MSREKIIRDFQEYKDYCIGLKDAQAKRQKTINSLGTTSEELIAKNRMTGYRHAQFHLMRRRARQKPWEALIIFFVIMEVVINIVNYNDASHLYGPSFEFYFWTPLIFAGILTWIFSTKSQAKFTPVPDQFQTEKYRKDAEYLKTLDDWYYNRVSEYGAYYPNSEISGYILAPKEINFIADQIDSNFQYPIVSEELQWIMQYIGKKQADTIHEAAMMYTTEVAISNQHAVNQQLLENTANAANDAHEAAVNSWWHR